MEIGDLVTARWDSSLACIPGEQSEHIGIFMGQIIATGDIWYWKILTRSGVHKLPKGHWRLSAINERR